MNYRISTVVRTNPTFATSLIQRLKKTTSFSIRRTHPLVASVSPATLETSATHCSVADPNPCDFCQKQKITKMTMATFHRHIRTTCFEGFSVDYRTCNGIRNSNVRFLSRGLGIDSRLLSKGCSSSSLCKCCMMKASSVHSTALSPMMFSDPSKDDLENVSDESTLILIRHGESFWNEMNLFSGCVDVPLTAKGIEEAIEAGKRINNIPIDIIFTSALARAQMTAMLAMTQHRCKKVPVVTHNENEQAKIWSQIYSENTKKQSIPVVRAWQLNERIYGELQGFNKKETAEKYGKEKVHEWRRSYFTCPPNGESLEMCSQRAVAYFMEHIEPQLLLGKHVMVAAHANSLRAIIMYLDKLTSQEVISLELSNGIPMLYTYTEGKFIRRGSPLGSTEAGVYAYTPNLALYRHKLDEMSKDEGLQLYTECEE